MDQNIKNEPPKKSKIGGFFKSFVDVKTWVSYNEITTNTKSIYSLLMRFFSSQTKKTVYKETFAEAVIRLNLTAEQINARKKIFLYSAIIYLFVALILTAYTLYLVMHAHILLAIFTLLLTTFVATLAYREHLWYMQMSKKRLGCSFMDWLEFVFYRQS